MHRPAVLAVVFQLLTFPVFPATPMPPVLQGGHAEKQMFHLLQSATLLLEVQPEGKKRMKAADFLRGKSIPYGTVLGKVEQK